MADPNYPNPAASGVVGRAVGNRGSQIDDAESAALNPGKQAAPAAPAAPSGGIVDRVKSFVRGTHNPENQLDPSNMHAPGSR